MNHTFIINYSLGATSPYCTVLVLGASAKAEDADSSAKAEAPMKYKPRTS